MFLFSLLRYSSLTFVCTGLLFLAGCTSTSHRYLVLRLGGNPSVINPVLSTDSASSSVEGLVFSGLFRVSTNMELEPDLVATYTVFEDGLRYRFVLRPNLKFQDGHPLTAEDVKFTVDTLLNPKTNTVRRNGFVVNGKPIRFKIIDPLTIDAILPEPFSPFLVEASIGILPKHLLEGKDINTATFNRQPVGSGPFKMVDWKPDQYVRLVRNERYYGKEPKLPGIIYKIIPDAQSATIAFEKGETDATDLLPNDFPKFANAGKYQAFKYYGLEYTYMGFNLKDPRFADPRLRQAIAHAIDKAAIVHTVLKGYGRVTDVPSSPVLWAYPDPLLFKPYGYDPQKSLSLLTALGYHKNPRTGLMEKNGKPLSFTLITNKGNKNRERSAELIQQYLHNIGIDMKIQLMEWSSFVAKLNENAHPKSFEVVMLGWQLGIDPAPYFVWHSTEYPIGFNLNGYQNAQVDAWIEQGRKAHAMAERKTIYQAALSQIGSDLPYVFLYIPENLVGVNKRVKGLSKPGPAGLFNPIEDVYLDP